VNVVDIQAQAKAIIARVGTDPERALSESRQLLDLSEESQFAWKASSYVKYATGDLLGAIYDIGMAISIEGEEPAYYFTKSRYCIEAEMWGDALDSSQKGIIVSRRFDNVYYVDELAFAACICKYYLGNVSDCYLELSVFDDKYELWAGKMFKKVDIAAMCQEKLNIR
jgi:hypothetical protein